MPTRTFNVYVLFWCILCWKCVVTQFSGCSPDSRIFFLSKGISINYPLLKNDEIVDIYLYYCKTEIYCNTSFIEDLTQFLYQKFQPPSCTNNGTDNFCSYHIEEKTPGFYCAIMTIENCYIHYYTDTLCLSDDEYIVYENAKQTINAFRGLVVVGILAAVVICAVICLYLYRRTIKNSSISISDEEDRFLTGRRNGDASSLDTLKNDNVTILILYWYDNMNHFTAVKTFVENIERISKWKIAVFYKCKAQISSVGVANWVSTMINQASAIIVISSQGAVLQDMKISIEEDEANNVFLYGWRYITSKPNLCHNYNKVFNIRFNHTRPVDIVPWIVPNRHFVVETDYQELLQNICSTLAM